MTSQTEVWTEASENAGLSPATPQTVKMSGAKFSETPIKRNASEDNIQPPIDALREGQPSILRQRQIEAFRDGNGGLPAEKGFPIQIGSELFRLSGASIMSDGLLSLPISSSLMVLTVLEHPLISPSFSKIRCAILVAREA